MKNFNGTFKGYIGECLLKLTDANLILTRYFWRKKYFELFGKYLTSEQQEFLDKNWYSIDGIKITKGKPELYEVKTRNKHISPKPHWKTCFTESSLYVYKRAIELGFTVTVATIWLHNDWNFEIELEDLENADYHVSNPKPYDLRPADLQQRV